MLSDHVDKDWPESMVDLGWIVDFGWKEAAAQEEEGDMAGYTVEDFENAEFARHPGQPRGRLAMRCGKDWIAMGGASPDDYHGIPGSAGMVSEGWVPVSTSAADNDRRVERLKRQVTEQDITICRRNREIEELNRRIRTLEEVEAAPEPWREIADAMPSDWPKEVREHAAKTLHEAGAKMGEK